MIMKSSMSSMSSAAGFPDFEGVEGNETRQLYSAARRVLVLFGITDKWIDNLVARARQHKRAATDDYHRAADGASHNAGSRRQDLRRKQAELNVVYTLW